MCKLFCRVKNFQRFGCSHSFKIYGMTKVCVLRDTTCKAHILQISKFLAMPHFYFLTFIAQRDDCVKGNINIDKNYVYIMQIVYVSKERLNV